MEHERFWSKRDIWYEILVLFAISTASAAVLMVPEEERLVVILLTLPVWAFMASLWFFTWYELKEDHLYARSGPFVERIPYDRIRSIRESRNMWSSMALSRDRIEIRQHDKGFVTGTTYISPLDKQRFMELLKSRCNNLQE
ncbi:PH domain-containing protein [Youngiibacter fragilis]|uniref:Uncharacterized protein YyaB-like PH domain-containing protein n=1 Tax=Youngiibacter fragilis 232.1 TaxID=994573 RepID=V7I4S2_9CLOT|nr:PH domain-containing protein [Youngiibacter fragilis]ETA79987.1 hypothetical protein T472_0214215 [Youngiibacter fragilis 232.1]